MDRPLRPLGLAFLLWALGCEDDGGLLDGGPGAAWDLGADVGPDLGVVDVGVEQDDAGPVGPSGLPLGFRLTATARGAGTSTSGLVADCSLNFLFELKEELSRDANQVVYRGIHGGEVMRTVTSTDGAGFGFFADSFGEVEATLTFPEQVVLRIPINETAVERIWRNLARLEGHFDRAGRGQGTWTCGPFDLDQGGYLDNEIVVEGTWTAVPERIEPEPPEDAG